MTAFDTAAHTAEHLAEAAAPRLREIKNSTLDLFKPALALALPIARRLNWRMVAFGVVAGVAGYLLRSSLQGRSQRKAQHTRHKAPELNRWENEGGMVPTSAPSAPRPVDAKLVM